MRSNSAFLRQCFSFAAECHFQPCPGCTDRSDKKQWKRSAVQEPKCSPVVVAGYFVSFSHSECIEIAGKKEGRMSFKGINRADAVLFTSH